MKIIGDGGHAKVVCDIAKYYRFAEQARLAFVAIGDNAIRKRESERAREDGYALAILRHPSAIIADDAHIDVGTLICANVVVQPEARIGKGVILNTGCSIDHDCVIGDYAHIAPGAHLCGNVTVGEGALVGVGVGIAPNTEIPPWALVKARRLEICPMK